MRTVGVQSSDASSALASSASWDLELVEAKLSSCVETHSCKSRGKVPLPTRLLDLGPRDVKSGKITVIVPSEEEEESITTTEYAALSYCWGTSENFMSTTATLPSRRQGFWPSDLPLTVREAVHVTRRLGLRYLWVDALCIIQHCKDDWQRQSAKMDEVYGNAFVTIFAFGARDCEAGLYFRPGRDHAKAPTVEERLALIEKRFTHEPLNHRAWALQEWHLSARRLMFTSHGAIFDCPQGPSRKYGHGIYHYRLTQDPALTDWYLLAMGLCARDMKDPMDKLPAIAGLARRFGALSRRGCGRYLAGIWEASLPVSLLWCRNPGFIVLLAAPSRAGRPAAYRAPSWSWASVDGRLAFTAPRNFEADRKRRAEDKSFEGRWDVVSRVTSCEVPPMTNEEPYGQVESGWLHIGGPLRIIPARCMVQDKDGSFNLYPAQKRRDSDLVGCIWCDEDGEDVVQSIGAQVLHYLAVVRERNTGGAGNHWYWGLLLLEDENGCFRRIGCGWTLETWFGDPEERSIEIV